MSISIKFNLFNNGIYEYDFNSAFDSPSCIIIPIILSSDKFSKLKRKPNWVIPHVEFDKDKANITIKNFFNKFSFGYNKPINNHILNSSVTENEIIGVCFINILRVDIYEFKFEGNMLIISTMERQERKHEILPGESKRAINKQDLINYASNISDDHLKDIVVYYSYYERKTFGEQIKCYILPQSIMFEFDNNVVHKHIEDLREEFPGVTYIITYNGYKAMPNSHGLRGIIIPNSNNISRNGFKYIPEEIYDLNNELTQAPMNLSDVDMQYIAHENIPELHQ